MKQAETIIKVRPNYRTHIHKSILEAIGVEPGDYIKVIVSKANDD